MTPQSYVLGLVVLFVAVNVLIGRRQRRLARTNPPPRHETPPPGPRFL